MTSEGKKVPLRLLCDTGASQTLISEGLVDAKDNGNHVLLSFFAGRSTAPLNDLSILSLGFSDSGSVVCMSKLV